jgi:replicative DNA helicase
MMPASQQINERVAAMVEAAQAATLGDAAIAYARAGVSIFPTQPRSKTPLKGSRGHLDATTDLAKVTEWWTAHPEANIACSPGRSGFLVIDIDGPARKEDDGTLKMVADGRKTWRRLRAEHNDSRPYFRTLSPGKGKGQHAWHRYPDGKRIGAPKLTNAPGLQAYGVLGYVMLPPSVHPEGPSYAFDTECYDVPEVPTWLLDRIPETSTSLADNASEEDVREFVAQHSGQGLTKVWRVALESEADQIRQADLRHPVILSALARVVGWAATHDDLDLEEAIGVLHAAVEEAFAGEDRRYNAEFLRALRWVVGHETAEIAKAKKAEEEARYGEWPPLRPLSPEAISAPLGHLPASVRAVVDTVSRHTQTPPEHAMLAALSTISAATVGKAVIDLGWIEPGSLWTLSVAEPSDRKSAVLSEVTSKPLKAAILAVSDGLTDQIREHESKVKAATARLAAVEKGMQKEAPTATAMDWAKAREELDEIEPLVVPEFVITDATPESIEMVMESQHGAAAAVSAEGDLINSLAGRYSDSQARVGPLNSAWSGESIYIRRVKGNRTIIDPHLSMTMVIQPTVLNKIGQTALFIESGFSARFLYAVPASRVGYRDLRSLPLDGEAVTRWTSVVSEILARFWGAKSKTVLGVDGDGEDVIRDLRGKVEALLRDKQLTQAERYWLGKAVGQIGRVSMMFALADDPAAEMVAGGYVERAAGLFNYFLHEARVAFGQSVELEGADVEHAQAIALWTQRREALGKLQDSDGLKIFQWRDLTHYGPRKYRQCPEEDRFSALELLADCNYVRPLGEVAAATERKGGRPSGPRWAVSPRVLEPPSEVLEPPTPATEAERAKEAETSPRGTEQGVLEPDSGFRSQLEPGFVADISPAQKGFGAIGATSLIHREEKREGGDVYTEGSLGGSSSEPLSRKSGSKTSREPLTSGNRPKTGGSVMAPMAPKPPLETPVPAGQSTCEGGGSKTPPTQTEQPPPASTAPKPPPAGYESLDEWCNPNLSRGPLNAYVVAGFPKLNPDGSCSACGLAEVHRLNGFVVCTACRTSFTALVVGNE